MLEQLVLATSPTVAKIPKGSRRKQLGYTNVFSVDAPLFRLTVNNSEHMGLIWPSRNTAAAFLDGGGKILSSQDMYMSRCIHSPHVSQFR